MTTEPRLPTFNYTIDRVLSEHGIKLVRPETGGPGRPSAIELIVNAINANIEERLRAYFTEESNDHLAEYGTVADFLEDGGLDVAEAAIAVGLDSEAVERLRTHMNGE